MPSDSPAAAAAREERLFAAPHFRNPHVAAALRWIHRFPFGVLVSAGPEGPRATSLPFVIEDAGAEGIFLLSHLARRNGHVAELAQAGEVLVVFNGPSAYVSPRWYASAANVPTWNYVTVQVRGEVVTSEDDGAIRRILERTAEVFEGGAPRPWTLADAPGELVDRLMKGVVALRIGPCRFECAEKLGQNKTGGDFDGVIDGLQEEGDELGHAVARLMAELREV